MLVEHIPSLTGSCGLADYLRLAWPRVDESRAFFGAPSASRPSQTKKSSDTLEQTPNISHLAFQDDAHFIGGSTHVSYLPILQL